MYGLEFHPNEVASYLVYFPPSELLLYLRKYTIMNENVKH